MSQQDLLTKQSSQIRSFSFDQLEIISNIIRLYIPDGAIHCDATYGFGGFYKNGRVKRPEFCYDQNPHTAPAVKGDSRNLPHDINTLNSIMFDPPFVLTDHKNSDHYLMHKRFSGFKLISELREMYLSSIQEFQRKLKPGGVLIVKCQDCTHAKKNYMIHNEVINMAEANGFMSLDLFVLLAKNRFTGRIKQQRTARKFHCYFLVFRKRTRNRKPKN